MWKSDNSEKWNVQFPGGVADYDEEKNARDIAEVGNSGSPQSGKTKRQSNTVVKYSVRTIDMTKVEGDTAKLK